MRTIVDFPDDQVVALSELRRSLGISRAEAIRRALAQMLEHKRGNARESAFGAWKGKKPESAGYVLGIRREWGA